MARGRVGVGGALLLGSAVALGSAAGAAAPARAGAGTTERVSLGPRGRQADGLSFDPALSADGRFVAFVSDAADLVPGDTNRVDDIFVRVR